MDDPKKPQPLLSRLHAHLLHSLDLDHTLHLDGHRTVMPLHCRATAPHPFPVSFICDFLSVLFHTKWNYLVFLFMFRYLMNLSLVFGSVTDTNLLILILSKYPSLGDKYEISWKLGWAKDWFSILNLRLLWVEHFSNLIWFCIQKMDSAKNLCLDHFEPLFCMSLAEK